MKPDAYLPFYGNDFFSATDGFSELAAMAYLRALWHYWSHTHATGLPEDDDYLRRVCRCQLQEWCRVKGLLFDNDGPFFQLENGKWHQPKAKKLYTEILETYERKVAGAAKARAKSDINPDVNPVITHIDTPQSESESESYIKPEPEPKPDPSIAYSACAKKKRPDWHSLQPREKLIRLLGIAEGTRYHWLNRLENAPGPLSEVLDAIHSDLAIGRVIKNRSAYAEHLWKLAFKKTDGKKPA